MDQRTAGLKRIPINRKNPRETQTARKENGMFFRVRFRIRTVSKGLGGMLA